MSILNILNAIKREAHVVEVTGYENAAGEAIKTGEDLFTHGEQVFIDSVVGELRTGMSLLSEEKKDLDELPDYLLKGEGPSTGLVMNVGDSAYRMIGDTTDPRRESSR